MPFLLLASASPRRRELLHQLGIKFDVIPSRYEERMDLALSPVQLVEQHSLGKALDVQKNYPSELVLGADTVVVLDGAVLGKPTDTEDAVQMLQQLQGRWHVVHTGIALVEGEYRSVRHRSTRVRLRPLTPEQVRAYVDGGEPLDKAGSYAIQGLGAGLVEAIDGCYTNVVGLSLPLLVDMLVEFGRPIY